MFVVTNLLFFASDVQQPVTMENAIFSPISIVEIHSQITRIFHELKMSLQMLQCEKKKMVKMSIIFHGHFHVRLFSDLPRILTVNNLMNFECQPM